MTAKINVGGVYKDMTDCKVNIGGVWKPVTDIFNNIDGVWKSAYTSTSILQRTLTIDNTKVDSTLTNYPIMVKLTSGNFDFSTVRTDGFDIAFYDNSDTLLAFEIEYFDKPTSSAVFHVKIPSISSTVDTTFKMKYGDNNAVDLSNKTAVWDSNFVMVQHMGTSLLDSTSNGNNGINYGTTVVDGLNGKARNFDGVNDYINFGTIINNTNNFTITSLVNTDVTSSDGCIFSSWDGTGWLVWFDEGTRKVAFYGNSSGGYGSTTYASDINYLTSFVKTSTTNIKVMLDGASDFIKTITNFTTSPHLYVGQDGVSSKYLDGQMDEFRLSNIARSDAWISADDYNLRLNTLLTIGV